jgi:hypothetical protein
MFRFEGGKKISLFVVAKFMKVQLISDFMSLSASLRLSKKQLGRVFEGAILFFAIKLLFRMRCSF